MKKVSWLIVIGIIIIVTVITNPKKEAHIERVSKIMMEVYIESQNIEGGNMATGFIMGLGSSMIDTQIKQNSNYKNYIIFSTLTNINGGKITIGLFGNIITMFDEEEYKETIKSNATSKTEITAKTKKTSSIKKWQQQFEITSIRTGYIASSYGWKPTLYFKLKSLKKNSIPDYLKVIVKFYDISTNKEIETITNYLEPFQNGKKDFLIITDKKYKKSPTSLHLGVKIYLEDEIAKELKVEQKDFHR